MRVRFTLNRYDLASGRCIAAARKVFGNRVARWANCDEDLIVECSADRFVSFQIIRNEYGATNGFKNLNLEIIEPKPKTKILVESFD
jgi:hypothetical protein